jgi:glutamyl-tRNA reductase (EC 1.2.1.70)
VRRIVVANRTLERASILAEQFGAHAVLLADIPQELANSDIVISSPPASCRSSARARWKAR